MFAFRRSAIYGTTVEASANVAKANTDSTYESVKEQSGLYAGKGGFDVTVKGNTDLKGAAMASAAEPDKYRLVTGTLTTSDIENKAEYKSESSSVSLSYSGGSSNPNGTITAPGGIKPDGTRASGTVLQTAGSNIASNAAGNAIGAKEGTTSGTTRAPSSQAPSSSPTKRVSWPRPTRRRTRPLPALTAILPMRMARSRKSSTRRPWSGRRKSSKCCRRSLSRRHR